MPRIHTKLAKAVQSHIQNAINGGGFNAELGAGFFETGFAVKRVNVPIDELTKVNDLQIVVWPGERSTVGDGRDADERTYAVQIAIMEKLQKAGESDTALAELERQDELVGLGELIEQEMERTIFDIGCKVGWVGSQSGIGTFPLLPQALVEWGQVSTVVSLEYMAVF